MKFVIVVPNKDSLYKDIEGQVVTLMGVYHSGMNGPMSVVYTTGGRVMDIRIEQLRKATLLEVIKSLFE